MVVIIDYGVGNLFSLKSSFAAIGADAAVSRDVNVIRSASHIILPGVGAFADAASKLNETGMDELVKEAVSNGKPVMGICLGMQLLFEKSYEYGIHKGLGLIKGNISPLSQVLPPGSKVPHIGWNSLTFKDPTNKGNISPIFKYINEHDHVYFVHSFYGTECVHSCIASCEYNGIEITAAVAKENLYGCQFHPEKSGNVGLKILKAFHEIK